MAPTRSKKRRTQSRRKSSISHAKQPNHTQVIRIKVPARTWKRNEFYTVEYICTARIKGTGSKRVWEYEVKWYGWAAEYNSWEPSSSFEKASYPILENFWKSHISQPEAPNAREYKSGKTIESTPMYRNYETQETIAMAKLSGTGRRDSKATHNARVSDGDSSTLDSSGEELLDAKMKPFVTAAVNTQDTPRPKKPGPLPRKNAGPKAGRVKTY